MTSRGKVVSIAAAHGVAHGEARFLDLLDQDIREAPDAVLPVPLEWATRMRALREKAEANERSELMEG